MRAGRPPEFVLTRRCRTAHGSAVASLRIEVLDDRTVPSVTVGHSSSAGASGAAGLIWSHMVGGAADRILIVDVSIDGTQTVSSITYAGQSLTPIGKTARPSGPQVRTELWYLLAPPPGSANVVVTLGGTADLVAGATDFAGVDQTTPLGLFVAASGAGGNPSVGVSAAAGDLLVGVAGARARTSATVGSGQSQLWQRSNGPDPVNAWGGSSTTAGSTSAALNWVTSGSGAGEWSAGAVALHATGPSSTSGGSPPVAQALPAGVSVTGDSFLVAADNTLYRVNSLTGTVIATYPTNLANDGVAVAANGNIYVADYANDRIGYYDPFGNLINDFSTNGLTPQGLTFGQDGNIYVTTTSGTVERFAPDGSNHTTFIAAGSGGLDNAKGLVWGPDGNAYVSSYFNSEVLRYNGTTGAFLNVFATGSGGFEDLTFGPDGDLYVASYGDGTVYRYRGSDGSPLGAFASNVPTAYGLRFDPDGNLAVSSRSAGQIQTFDGSTGAFVGSLDTGLPSPAYIAATSSLVTNSAGGTATFWVALNTRPAANITITLTSSAPDQGNLSQATLTFTPTTWDTPQAVTVTGLDDGVANGDQVYQIGASVASADGNYNGIPIPPVTVLNREVTPPNRPPTAIADSVSTGQNTPLTVSASGVLANDTDPDGDPLTVTAHTDPANGKLAINADGSFTYTPSPAFRGTDSFTYQVSDLSGASSTATVTIRVIPPNGNPTAGDDSYTTGEDAELDVPAPGVLANDTPPGNLPLTAQLVSPPTNGTLTFNSDGSFTYVPDGDFVGTDEFVYKAVDINTDSSGAAHVTITVTGTEAPPVAVPDAFATDAGMPLRVAAAGVLANDTVADGAPLTAVLVAGPAHGSVTLKPDGSFVYAPVVGFSGVDSFTYAAQSGSQASAAVAVTITVRPAASPTPTSVPTPVVDPIPGPTGGPETPNRPAIPPSSEPTTTPTPSSTSSDSGTTTTGAKGSSVPAFLPPPVVVSPTVLAFGVGMPAGGFFGPGPGPGRPAEAGPAPTVVPSPPPPGPMPIPAATLPPRSDTPPAAPVTRVFDPPVVSVVPPVPVLGADNPVFTGLDELKGEVTRSKRVQVAAGTAVGTGMALTAGTVLFSPRLAYWFLSALLARRTVWKPFDPLEVMYAWDREHGPDGPDADDDSLERLVG